MERKGKVNQANFPENRSSPVRVGCSLWGKRVMVLSLWVVDERTGPAWSSWGDLPVAEKPAAPSTGPVGSFRVAWTRGSLSSTQWAEARVSFLLCFLLKTSCRKASVHMLSPSSVGPHPQYVVAVDLVLLSPELTEATCSFCDW